MSIYPRFAPLGDSALSVEFDNEIDPAVNARVRALDRAIIVSNLSGVVETVPGFRSLLIIYEPEIIELDSLTAFLRQLLQRDLHSRAAIGRSWTVPVAYGVPDADDLREIGEVTGLSRDEIIALHAGAEYQVYIVGFVPGLPVLGGLPSRLHISRRAAPRPDLPAGRVMIGGMQGLIVPMPMPTGYYSVGQTPLRPYDRNSADPFLFRPGDRIRFRPIPREQLDSLARLPGHHFLNVDG